MIPANFKAEQAVIGDILLAPEQALPLAVRDLTGEEFTVQSFRDIFDTCRTLFRENRPVDAVTVLAQLGSQYQEAVITAAEQVPSVSHISEYIRILSENYRRRQAWEHASALLKAIESGTMEECQFASSELLRSFSDRDPSKSLDAKTGMLDFVQRKDHPKNYIKTGFSKLDRVVHLDFGDYVVVGGRPSSGKTAFTLQIMLTMAKEYPVVYFSLETSAEKMMDRLISCYTRTPFQEIKSGQIRDWTRITERYDDFKALNFQIVEAAGWTVEQILVCAVQMRAKIILIDYLSLIRAQGHSLYERVTNISIDLHTMAQKNKIAVIALSQLNRDSSDREPDMTSLRESGQIEQDADCILLLHLADKDDPFSDRDLIVAKNKEGSTGKIRLAFQGEYQLFTQKKRQTI